MRFCFLFALLLALLHAAHLDKAHGQTIQGKKIDTLKAAVHAALKADPNEADAYIAVVFDGLHYNFDHLVFLFSNFDRRDEIQHLAVAEAIRLKFPDMRKEWEPHFAALDHNIKNQLEIPKTDAKRYYETDSQSRKIVRNAMQAIASAKKANKGVIADRMSPKQTEDSMKTAQLYNVQFQTEPPGARKYYSTVFLYTLMDGLGIPEQAWKEALTKVTPLGGNYYFKAQWQQESIRFGPHIVRSDGPLLLKRP